MFSDAIVTKIKFAERRLEELSSSLEQFLADDAYQIDHIIDATTGEKSVVCVAKGKVPNDFAAIVGEIVHNLRSSLDYAVTELTKVHSGSQLPLTEFPIFDDKQQFFKMDRESCPARGSGMFKIRGMSPEAQKIVVDLQPFNFTEAGSVAVLSLIHKLSNADKHKTIHLCRRSLGYAKQQFIRDVTFNGELTWFMPLGILPDRAVLASWFPTILTSDPDLEIEIKYDIVFDVSTAEVLGGAEVLTTCDKLIKGVKRVLHYLEQAGAS